MSDYVQIWKERKKGLEAILGDADNSVLTSPVPIYLGGFADVMSFSEFVPGKTYVTGGLTGLGSQKPNDSGCFELMICTRAPSNWAGNLISKLAKYTHDAVLTPGDTMSIDSAVPKGSTISALLFTRPDLPFGEYFVQGESCHLMLCVGITARELKYKTRQGSDALLQALQDKGVLPYTDLNRQSAV